MMTMTLRMHDLASEIVRLQVELDREIECRRKALGWSVKARFVEFEHNIAFDQGDLAYPNWIEVLTRLYCSYANRLIAYVREIAIRTEHYWCPIEHALKVTDPPRRCHAFLEYGDAAGNRARLEKRRDQLRADPLEASKAPS